MEQSREGILISDVDGAPVYANSAYETLTGQELKAGTVGRLQDLLTTAGADDPLVTVIVEQREWRGTVMFAAHGGNARQLETIVAPLHDTDGRTLNFVAVMRDVTHERAMEDRLRQGQKLEAIGTLAGGIAHDFNNIIGSILAVAEHTRDDAEAGSRAKGMQQIIVACNRARDIVRKMMAFSRHSTLMRKPISIATILEETLPLLRAAIPSTIGFHVDLRARGFASVDPTEVHQILMNLATNSAHAMAERGSGMLQFTLTCLTPDEAFARAHHHLRPGSPYLVLEVADTGHGIPKAHVDRIFDPFFTTKRPTEGTGLGLASVHGIVRSLGGDIDVTSEVGRGTTFRVYLPEVEELPEVTPAPDPPVVHTPGNVHVLMVDDEPALLAMQRRALVKGGYTVTAVSDGLEARRVFLEAPDRFDLLFTDLTMPGIGGLELIRDARAARPEIPVILTSGNSDAAGVDELASAAIDGFLAKPYNRKELLQLVGRVLSERRPKAHPG